MFPYYAGYSSAFTERLLLSMRLDNAATVFDPWNGSGTTTYVAGMLGYQTAGVDLNPAMVVVAKAAMLSSLEAPSLVSLGRSLVMHVGKRKLPALLSDPLLTWLSPSSSSYIRSLEYEINKTLINSGEHVSLCTNTALRATSPLAAFFYVALFRTVRRLLSDFIPTNPTWTKKPSTPQHRKNPSWIKISSAFLDEVNVLSNKISISRDIEVRESNHVSLTMGNAEKIALKNASIDVVISSPPYCTRIDYAVATSIELAILGMGETEFDNLRRTLTGTSTVEKKCVDASVELGSTCNTFLDQVLHHSSKASKSYYYKNHLQYFQSLSQSVSEIGRILKDDGSCILVVQDSHYKEIFNDVPSMVCEMAAYQGMRLLRRENFASGRTMAAINRKSKKYLSNRVTTESVLCFRRQ